LIGKNISEKIATRSHQHRDYNKITNVNSCKVVVVMVGMVAVTFVAVLWICSYHKKEEIIIFKKKRKQQ